MSAKDINIYLRNNTGNKTKESLIGGFVIRTKQFNNILSEIKLSKTDKPEQNYLIIGQRGAGKTTLLYRLKYAIEDDPELNIGIIPVMFSEEQYNLMDLVNLWEGIVEYLEEISGFEFLQEEINKIDANSSHKEELIFEVLEGELEKSQKKIIVFVENVDAFFKKIGKHGQQRLREVLSTSKRVRMICSATTFFEGIIDYSEPFYEFFKIVQLNGLNRSESMKLLHKLAEHRNATSQLEQILKEHPKRLESLRRLTGGNPRIISYLFHIFQDNENGNAIVDLYKLLDDITYLYKAELDQLSAQQQKLIDIMARNWDAIATKDIANRANIESKHVSSILKTLERNQVIESINTKTKNNLYRIKDRFLNIWYLMRFGKKKERENVIWLVRFYDAWCDRTELSQRIDSLLKASESDQYDPEATIDMGNVYLSCKNVAPNDRFELHQKMQSKFPEHFSDPLPDNDVIGAVIHFVESGEFEKALEAIEQVDKDSEEYFYLGSWLYFRKGDDQNSTRFLEKYFERNPSPENAFKIATLFDKALLDYENALKYFEKSLTGEMWESALHLGEIYMEELDNYELAEKYLLIAEEKNINDIGEVYALLGKLRLVQDRDTEAEEFLLKGAEKENATSGHLLGHFYVDNNNWEKAKEYFLKSLDWGKKSSFMCFFISALDRNEQKEIPFILQKFEEIIAENPENYAVIITYARALLWDDQIEKAINLVKGIEPHIFDLLDDDDENEKKQRLVFGELSVFFVLLIAKGQFNAANAFFQSENERYKQTLKPIYFALMHYMDEEYPNEFLKAGDELKETINEIINEIENCKKIYK
jgi:tetratricopeptide (TPR) repeat protein